MPIKRADRKRPGRFIRSVFFQYTFSASSFVVVSTILAFGDIFSTLNYCCPGDDGTETRLTSDAKGNRLNSRLLPVSSSRRRPNLFRHSHRQCSHTGFTYPNRLRRATGQTVFFYVSSRTRIDRFATEITFVSPVGRISAVLVRLRPQNPKPSEHFSSNYSGGLSFSPAFARISVADAKSNARHADYSPVPDRSVLV